MKYSNYIQNRAADGDGAEAFAIITDGATPSVSEAYAIHDAIGTATEEMTDATASKCAALFPGMKYDGALIPHKTRINWNGTVMVAAVDLWDREENDPDHAPTLWEALDYRDGIRIIPETITLAKAFSEGELGWWGDEVYRSKVNMNVYTPAQYAPNWEKA